jgi:hypothetical protein
VEELQKLLTAYGNACFDSGEWDEDKNPVESYETVMKRVTRTREAILKAWKTDHWKKTGSAEKPE